MSIVQQFEKMGARVRIRPPRISGTRIDIMRDREGAFFDIQSNDELRILDVQPKDRHLLLMVTDPSGDKYKYLCGHDERNWFVATVPPSTAGEKVQGVSNVRTAKDALRPPAATDSLDRKGVKSKDRQRRKNPGYIRQGEWFFIPDSFVPGKHQHIFRDEPIRVGRGRAHICEMLCRTGGVDVWVSRAYPNGITDTEYKKLARQPGFQPIGWRLMRRDATVFVKGSIRHPDHKTIRLETWHRVIPNRESQAPGARNVAFLD